MKLTEEQIIENYEKLFDFIKKNISQPRRDDLLKLYTQFEETIATAPASTKEEYHSAFPGGYVYHVLNVLDIVKSLYNLYGEKGANVSNFTKEELLFSALNHDLGKIGNYKGEAYIPQPDKWRRKNLGEKYTFNTELQFMEVPHRSIFLLQKFGVTMSENEIIAILTHDGLYNEANSSYLKGFNPHTKPRTNLPYILHQADLIASRIEFEQGWLYKQNLSQNKNIIKTNTSNKNIDNKFTDILNKI